MLDFATATRSRKIVHFPLLDDRPLRVVKGMMRKVAMEVSGNGLPLFSIRSMDSYSRNYVLAGNKIFMR